MIHVPGLNIQRMAALLVLCATLPAHAAFHDNGDGTVTDTTTNLEWDQCAWGSSGTACAGGGGNIKLTWNQALGRAVSANSANYKNHSDWRLPNRNELETLVDVSRSAPAIDTVAFPNTEANPYWSSTSSVSDPAPAWYVNSYDGRIDSSGKSNDNYVRLVD